MIQNKKTTLLPEQNVWEYVVQLASMIRSVHAANLAVRIVMPSRILVDHKSRLRLSGVGIFDVLDQENSPASIAQHQVGISSPQDLNLTLNIHCLYN